MPKHIYFDESGFTGNNLLHPEQNYFAYGSVSSEPEEAKDFVEYLIKKYGIQGGELKGSKLVRFSKGRKAIDEIHAKYEGRVKVSISDKKYALACKLYEYIFEPCYSEINSLFYNIGFHEFISNILYLELVCRAAGAEEIFTEFESLMRALDADRLISLFSSSQHPENSPVISQIREFAQYRHEDVRSELESLSSSRAGKWILDLTNSALFTLLANWGSEHGQLVAVCDSSKPLEHDPSLFNAMVGNEKQLFTEIAGRNHPITFNLARPIEFSDSKTCHGIQIADAIAASAVYAYMQRNDPSVQRWREWLVGVGDYGSVLPDFDKLDLDTVQAKRNAVILMELHSRAKSGKDLINGMPEFIRACSLSLMHSSRGA